jgi:hypothetical protein
MGTRGDNVSAAAWRGRLFAGTNVSLADALRAAATRIRWHGAASPPSLLCGRKHDSSHAVTIGKFLNDGHGKKPNPFRDSMNGASTP